MAACLYLWHINKAGGAANQCAAWECKLWDRLQAALVETPCTILQHGPTSKQLPDLWVRFPALKLLIRIEIWITVVKGHHQPAAAGGARQSVLTLYGM